MVPRWRFLATFLRPVFSASRVQQVSDLHFKCALRPPCVEVWQTSNLRRLRLGEEKKERKTERKNKLECGPMPKVMVALPNIGGAPCSTPQSLADAHY